MTVKSTENQNHSFRDHPDKFSDRHIGPSSAELSQMAHELGVTSLDDLVEKAVPSQIRTKRPLDIPMARSEHQLLRDLKNIAAQNRVFRSYIGMGYHDCITPPVIQRNILENPNWYTPYTPYQAEVSQGRLESLLNFQTMITDLTGMEIANASLLDEGTAAAEAMAMCFGIKEAEGRNRFFISNLCHPQTIDVVKARGNALGVQIEVGDHKEVGLDSTYCGVLLQYPATNGEVLDYTKLIEQVHVAGALAIVAADLLSLTLLRPPGEFGADVAVGNSQRFGVPMGYGGPHAAFFATRDAHKRHMPGRLIGISKDSGGRPGFRLSLQTREQHIRREKATSNICTAQALLANMAAMYAIYHGPNRLRQIAERIHFCTQLLAGGLGQLGFSVLTKVFFDTITVSSSVDKIQNVLAECERREINLRVINGSTVAIAVDETVAFSDVEDLLTAFNEGKPLPFEVTKLATKAVIDSTYQRTSGFLAHPVFNQHHSETEMLRYIKRLESKDLSLATSMIPLGSCTMKLNATTEMYPLSWPEFSKLHPFVPLEQARGYQILIKQLEAWLGDITGFPGVSLQPNAGSQGEYAGLLAVQQFHARNGERNRNICLIPSSAHGTNPASAVMAGLKVVAVSCDGNGNIDLVDLRAKAQTHKNDLSVLMVTYPSTHGVFEETIKELSEIVHTHGGQVYMDGANMNAQVGLCRPAELGVDVCHLNLHKTFCIPHGGGGPGVGPTCVAKHLIPFLPAHAVVDMGTGVKHNAVSAAPWGSASILTISWVYIALMGPEELTRATKVAILNANYIARRLAPFFPVLYKGKGGFVAHECILDLRQYKSVTVEDVAKRLMDYGFHAPTISWPVPGTMMIEPTESETKEELDRFCESLISIHAEIKSI